MGCRWFRVAIAVLLAGAVLLGSAACPSLVRAAEVRGLSAIEVEQRLADVPEWTIVDEKLHREFQFANFIEAFGWMSSAALIAESVGHHPEWCNVYNRVAVDLTTHDAGGLSELDFELARRMDKLAG